MVLKYLRIKEFKVGKESTGAKFDSGVELEGSFILEGFQNSINSNILLIYFQNSINSKYTPDIFPKY